MFLCGHQQGCYMSVRQENLNSECFLCLPELRPIILEADGTLGFLLWARVLDFQNSYIQQIQGLFLESSSKPHVVAGTDNVEYSQTLVL